MWACLKKLPMSTIKSTAKNISYLLVARTCFRFLTAIALTYAANYLGGERYGMLETATAWSNALLAMASVGMSQLAIREASRDKSVLPLYFGNALLIEAIVSLFIFAIIIIIGLALPYSDTVVVLMAITAAGALIYEFRKLMRGAFRVTQNMGFIAIQEAINGALFLISTIVIFAVVHDKAAGLYGIVIAQLAINTLSVIVLLIYTLRSVTPVFDVSHIRGMLKQSYSFGLNNVFFMLYFQIDQIIISILLGTTAVGIYSAPTKVVYILLFIPSIVFQVTTPLMFRWSVRARDKYKQLNRIQYRYLSAVGIPAGIGLSLLAGQIIPLIFHRPEYTASIPIMEVMGAFLAIRFIGIALSNALTTSDRQQLRALLQIVFIGLNIILDILLIRQYGIIGAAYGSTISELGLSLACLIVTIRYLRESPWQYIRDAIPILLASSLMGLVLILVRQHLHVILVVAIGTAVYALALYLFRFFQPGDKAIFKQLMPTKST